MPDAEDPGTDRPRASDGQRPPARKANAPAPDRHVSEERLAKVAVQSGMASAEAVEECVLALKRAEEEGLEKTLLEVMIGRGVLTLDEAQAVTAAASAKAGGGLLAGFQLIEELGEGGMGVVYKARQVSLDRLVAVKFLPRRLAQDREFVVRFEREARTAAKIEHENIVGAIDVGISGGQRYFVMEYVKGRSIGQILEEEGSIPQDRALDMVIQVARGLEAAWRHGLVHRDVKPDNILLTPDGVAKLADLGLAKNVASSDDTRTTRTGSSLGTAGYVSPEQIDGARVDIRSDIYSLGATFYHMVTGKPAFSGKNTQEVVDAHFEGEVVPANEVNPEVSAETASVIAVMTAREPEARHPDPQVLLHDLLLLAGGRRPEFAGSSESARRRAIRAAKTMKAETSVVYERVQPSGLRRLLVGVAAGAAAVAAAGVAIVLASGGGKEEPGPRPGGEASHRARVIEAAREEVRWLVEHGEFERAVERATALSEQLGDGGIETLRLVASRRLADERRGEAEEEPGRAAAPGRVAPPGWPPLSAGEFPTKDGLLDLTEEQRAAVEKLAAERRAEISRVYRQANAQTQKINADYDAKLLDLLTPQQRELLKGLLDRGESPAGGGARSPGDANRH